MTRVGPNRLRVVLREGRNRQIRRMLKLVHCEVTDLVRTHIGNIGLSYYVPPSRCDGDGDGDGTGDGDGKNALKKSLNDNKGLRLMLPEGSWRFLQPHESFS